MMADKKEPMDIFQALCCQKYVCSDALFLLPFAALFQQIRGYASVSAHQPLLSPEGQKGDKLKECHHTEVKRIRKCDRVGEILRKAPGLSVKKASVTFLCNQPRRTSDAWPSCLFTVLP